MSRLPIIHPAGIPEENPQEMEFYTNNMMSPRNIRKFA